MSEGSFLEMPVRKPIPGAEWVFTVQLFVDDKEYGEPFTMRYVDSVVAPQPQNALYLICRRIQEVGAKMAPTIKKKRKKDKEQVHA